MSCYFEINLYLFLFFNIVMILSFMSKLDYSNGSAVVNIDTNKCKQYFKNTPFMERIDPKKSES